MRRLGFVGLTLALAGCAASPDTDGSPPNIVLILTDDLGWADPGFNGSTSGLTPNIDALAREGTRFTSFYAHSVCAATRAALMTGRYAFRTNMDWRSEDFGKPTYLAKLGLELAHNAEGTPTRMLHALDGKERTIAEVLGDAGYFTSMIGKWHLGEWAAESLPMGQGFDHQYGHYGWGIDYNNYTIPHNAPARYAVYDWHRNQQPVFEQGYSTDLIANEAVRVITEQGEAPYFVYVAFNAIHGPLEEIPRHGDLDKRSAAIRCLDEAVGRVVGAVNQRADASNTLVVFTNDNGGLRDEFNRPYRGTKNTTYEGGVRMPCVMRWPGRITAGGENDAMMHVVDLLPTFASLAGTTPGRTLDGENLASAVLGSSEGRDEIVFEVEGGVRQPTVRSGRYKLMGQKLFDIVGDPTESRDIAGDHPEIVAQLTRRLEAAAEERPPLGPRVAPALMDPPLPWVYGQAENAEAPEWLKTAVRAVREAQPKSWAPGTTPWPQAPTGDTIIYTGDGR